MERGIDSTVKEFGWEHINVEICERFKIGKRAMSIK